MVRAGEPMSGGPTPFDDSVAATVSSDNAPSSPERQLPDRALAALARTLENGIDERLKETRTALRAWVREAVSILVAPAPDSNLQEIRRRKVKQALNLKGERAAEMLLVLVDQPDVHHDYWALIGSSAPGDIPASVKNVVRVRISHLRAQLKQCGVEYVIHNQNRRGYMVTSADAARIRGLWEDRLDRHSPPDV
jgi:hypothetical protein